MAESDPIVLVSGASGFIACHVIQQLQRAGYRVRGTVRSLKNEQKCQPIRELCPDAKHPVELVEADLLKEDTWPAAVAGCSYVMHTASPVPVEHYKHDSEIIRPALDGTLNVLRAVKAAGGVKRVVITSSIAAVHGGVSGENGRKYTEDDWTDPERENIGAYVKSKALAEKAAWDFVSALGDDDKFELSVVNPGYVFGDVISGGDGSTMRIPMMMMNRQVPALPRLCLPSIDVRDVAAAHVAAMTSPDAAGHRHILVTKNLWFKDMAQILADEFKPQGYNPPLTESPYWLMWIMARFSQSTRMMLPSLDSEAELVNRRMLEVLHIQPRSVDDAIVDMTYSLIERGLIKKTAKYKSRTTSAQ